MSSVELSDFDVAMQPGLREKLAGIYQEFRDAQSGSQTALHKPDLVHARSHCPGCGGDAGSSQLLFEKHGVPHVKCLQCDLVYTRTTLTPAADSAQYDDSAFMRAYVKLKRHPLYAQLESTKAAYLLQQARAFQPDLHTVLDIGASTGAVMAAALEEGLAPYGIEPDSAMAEPLDALHHEHFVNGYYPQDIPPHWPKFDLVTLLDVLEHMTEPLPFLQTLHAALSSRGLLLVQVPNFDSLLVQLDGAKNSNFCVGHWQHFTVTTLAALLQRAGFRMIASGNCISELDRIKAYPPDQIDAATTRILGHPTEVTTPDQLYVHGLGYKLYGIFSPSARS